MAKVTSTCRFETSGSGSEGDSGPPANSPVRVKGAVGGVGVLFDEVASELAGEALHRAIIVLLG